MILVEARQKVDEATFIYNFGAREELAYGIEDIHSLLPDPTELTTIAKSEDVVSDLIELAIAINNNVPNGMLCVRIALSCNDVLIEFQPEIAEDEEYTYAESG